MSNELSRNIWNDISLFNDSSKIVNALCKSELVPATFRNKPENCMIALDYASRLGASPLMVMQNMYIIKGNPSWSAKFMTGLVNRSGRYKTSIMYDISGKGDDYGCTAWVEDRAGNKITGSRVSIKIAKAEGWYSKPGSKWPNMPEKMLRYRAATNLISENCSDIVLGMESKEEIEDAVIIEAKEPEHYRVMNVKKIEGDKQKRRVLEENQQKQEAQVIERPDPEPEMSEEDYQQSVLAEVEAEGF